MIKNIVWWAYERASWQWDLLCLLILAFIFLTPKEWFEKRERLTTKNATVSRQSRGKSEIRNLR